VDLPAAQRLASRRLYLDHVGAGLGEQEAGVGPLVDLTQIENADSRERFRGLRFTGHGAANPQWKDPPITSRATIRR